MGIFVINVFSPYRQSLRMAPLARRFYASNHVKSFAQGQRDDLSGMGDAHQYGGLQSTNYA